MRGLGSTVAMCLAVLSTGAATAQTQYHSSDPAPKLAGVWHGTFRCGPADWQMDLAVSPVSSTRLVGTLSFAAKGSDPGAYLGAYGVEMETSGITANALPTQWLTESSGLPMLPLRGSQRGETYSGNVDHKECGKFSLTRAAGSETLARDIVQALPMSARVPIDPLGDWQILGSCRGVGVKGSLSIGEQYSGKIGGYFLVKQWDGDREGQRLINYHVAGNPTQGAGNVVRLEPTDSITLGGTPYAIVFTKTDLGWVGRSEDPSCTSDTLWRHPRPEKLVASTGEALEWEAWVGRSPFDTFAGQNLFAFIGLDQAAMIKPSELPGQLNWSVVSTHPKTMAFYACSGGNCETAPDRKAFFVFPRIYAAASDVTFASPLDAASSQVCLFSSNNQRWRCIRVPEPFPASATGRELYAWAEIAYQGAARKWADAHPGVPMSCARVARPHREDEDPTELRCSTPIPGPPMPTFDRQ